ncbi:MAG: response regulator [Chloroflexi bacterium]|nr:response regulator [Chloroflexota bacterium]
MADETRLHQARILVVDDDPTSVALLGTQLRVAGYTVVTAGSGQEALVAVAAAPPDVILLDVRMPGLDGYTVCRRLKADPATRAIPVALLTALRDTDSKVRGLDAGADDFLSKPVEHEELLARVRSLLRQKHLHDQLTASEALYRAVLEHAADAMSIVVEATVAYANPALLALLGVDDPAQVVGVPVAQFIHPEDWPEVIGGASALQVGRAQPAPQRYRIVRHSGEVRWVEASAVTISYGGQPATLSITRDVTERLRVEAALQASHDELERRVGERTNALRKANAQLAAELATRQQAEAALSESNQRLERALTELQAAQSHVIQQERLTALGEMASGIAHDFNNALSPIVGFSELLLARPDALEDREKVRSYLELINTAGSAAARVVDRLREFYRPRQADEPFDPVALDAVIAQALLLTQPKWKDQVQAKGRTIQVVTECQPTPSIAGDESALRDALINLIINAVDAVLTKDNEADTDERGLAKGHAATDTIAVRTLFDGTAGEVVVEVTDTGIGMPDDVRRRCLEPFFSTKGEHGTGLGLAMVHGIVQRHDGRVEILSTPGQGTTFTLRFPVRSETNKGDKGDNGENGAAAVPVAPLRIVVVDDEPRVRSTTAQLLAIDGHAVSTAASGQEALGLIERQLPDLLITDRAMPVMSGDQLAAALMRRAPGLPIILLTGFGELMASAGEHPPGVACVVGKPVALRTLRLAVARAVAASPGAATRTAAPSARVPPSSTGRGSGC